MRAIFNESTLRRFNLLAFPLALCWSLSTIGGAFLSSTTQESFSNPFEPFFEVFHFGQKFALSEGANASMHSKVVTTTTLVPDPHRIKAIYRSSSASLVSISDATKTTIVPLGGVYKNVFHLISLTDTTATFRGYGKTCRLRLGHDDPLVRQETLVSNVSDPSQLEDGESHTITAQTLREQIAELPNIEKNVDASAVVVGGKTLGFRINALPPQSVYAQLGIQNGDVIHSVNNKKLESYAAVLSLYSQIQNMRHIRITLERNNLPKEIVYEITR
ncbi:hypothetical protein [Sulfuricurvum sp.]|uniref:hypothetical protein n=1 Tax=Sulfuricurvum sp. TaxID=2025608 RepID=UPI002E3502B3|nr:hypothetical protein [Sulfuricurvum sp.]HEX5330210.1 hypothetical protein [Sulfuricurvum sp.]